MKAKTAALALLFALHSIQAGETIRWKPETRVLVQPGGQYGRMARLDGKTLLSVFTWNRSLQIRRSNDEGKTWAEPQVISTWQPGTVANAEILVLRNGEILAFFNRRPGKGAVGERYSIGCCRSLDRGQSWAEPTILYEGGSNFGDGCWEPAAVELPDGRIAVWFANEAPFPSSDEQEISVIFSEDRGVKWSGAARFSFRAGARDGMPVPIVTRDGKSVLVAIEDNGLSGTFKPVILSANLNSKAKFPVIDGDSSKRRGALAKPLPASSYAGAPYLRAFSAGTLVLSYQLADSGDMKDSRMAVSLGDPQGRSFGPPTFPFSADAGTGGQLWNALFIKSLSTVTAISETTVEGKRGIWAIDGELERSR